MSLDTESFEMALKNALRQAPAIIMIGGVRNRETMENTLAFAETGHSIDIVRCGWICHLT